MLRRSSILFFCLACLTLAQQIGSAGDWPDWRGPDRDGVSREKGLPEKWSLGGQNLAWKAPYGGRSTPVVLGDHLYLQNTAGKGETDQERILCLNADTGKLLWEYRFNVFQSDVPAHRVGWASPVADPETGNVYVFGVNNLLTALTKDGKKLWERSITEEFSPFTTHGGRTVSPIVDGNLVIVSTPTATWGTQANRAQRFIAAVDASGKGKLGKESIKWAVKGFMGGFSSPVIDADRIYQADNSSNLFAFDLETGRQLWKLNLGTIQKGSVVFGDGKIYIGSESGKFYILRPHADHCEVLNEVELPLSDQGLASQKIPEPVVASAAVARGRVYFVSSDSLYAIGPKRTPAEPWKPVTQVIEPGQGAPAWVQVAPTEMVLKPGDTVQLHARLYDAAGRFLREENSAAWSLEGLRGVVADGKFAVAPDKVSQAGMIKATAGGLTGEARARVIPPLAWHGTFGAYPLGRLPPHWVSP